MKIGDGFTIQTLDVSVTAKIKRLFGIKTKPLIKEFKVKEIVTCPTIIYNPITDEYSIQKE